MRPAAVGFHCPEEHGGGRGGQEQRRPRNVLGGRAGRPAVVTQVLIGLCVAAYALQGFPLFDSRVNDFTLDFALNDAAVAYYHEYYRLITAAFLHGYIIHIMFNMMALYVLGIQLEAIVGRVRYIALFILCAFGGNALSYVVGDIEPGRISLGASTAVFGFFAAYYLIARRLRADTSGILVIIGINLVLTFTLSNVIDIWGHIGGLITGLLLGLVFAYVPPRKVMVQVVAVAGVAAILVAAVLVKTASVAGSAGLLG
jgi:membrane associated rhomboid family serine protease